MTCTTTQIQDISKNPKIHKELDLPESEKYSGQDRI